jgi:hypothetical protein
VYNGIHRSVWEQQTQHTKNGGSFVVSHDLMRGTNDGKKLPIICAILDYVLLFIGSAELFSIFIRASKSYKEHAIGLHIECFAFV